MSEQHLRDLRNMLERNHWRVLEELPGDNYRVSGTWVISRPDGSCRLELAFSGLDDLQTLPVEESYGCQLKGASGVSLYFARVSRSWTECLSKFIEQLNEVASAPPAP